MTPSPFIGVKKVIKVDKGPYVILSIFSVFLIVLLSIGYFKRGGSYTPILFFLALYVLFLFNLACIRIEIDEDVIKYITLMRRKQIRVSDVLYWTTEVGTRADINPFKGGGFYRLIIVGESNSKLVINMKLFPLEDLRWMCRHLPPPPDELEEGEFDYMLKDK
jgi:hypothetical protein